MNHQSAKLLQQILLHPLALQFIGLVRLDDDLFRRGIYAPLVREIVKFFQTGVAPIAPEETIELFAFMEAADESKRQNGQPVKIADVMAKARKPAR